MLELKTNVEQLELVYQLLGEDMVVWHQEIEVFKTFTHSFYPGPKNKSLYLFKSIIKQNKNVQQNFFEYPFTFYLGCFCSGL